MGAAASAFVLLACTLLASWHQATVVHARCVEHGELVDVVGRRAVGDHQIAPLDGGAHGEHQDCTLCPRAHDGAPPSIAVVPATLPPVAWIAPAAPRARVIASRGTLRLAPKTSPPIVALSML